MSLFLSVVFLFNTQIFSLSTKKTSARVTTLKMGVLAPEGTAWANNLKSMAKEVRKKTRGRVKFKIYYGGTQGDEPDVLRKIRIGQLHGGIFTGKTLGDISGDVRSIEIPFNFKMDQNKAWPAVEEMTSFFNEKLFREKFVNLGFFELGPVYVVSTKEINNLKDLEKVKLWTWEGDKLAQAMISAMNLISVPLALPDVLSSFSTGIVEAAYAPPMGIVALQWNSRIKYLVDFPIAYSIGSFLVYEKYWRKVSSQDKAKAKKIIDSYIKKISEANRKDNQDALSAMKESGVSFIQFLKKDEAKAKSYRSKVVEVLKGSFFSKEVLVKLDSLR